MSIACRRSLMGNNHTKGTYTLSKEAWLMSIGGETSEGYCEVPAQARAGLMFRLASRGLSDSLKWWWH